MTNADNEDLSKPITPAFDKEKSMDDLSQRALNALRKVIDASKQFNMMKGSLEQDQENDLQNKFAFLQKAACTVDNSLQELVNLERRGKNPQMEGMLTQFIELVGTNLDQDIEYGIPISQEQRLKWQALGMDPDSENEVQEFLERNGIADSRQPDQENANTNKMRK